MKTETATAQVSSSTDQNSMQYNQKIASQFSQSEFAQGYSEFRYANSVQPMFDFSLRLPDTWTAYPVTDKVPSEQSPVSVLMTAHEGDKRIELVVWAMLMSREINPIDWLEGWIRSQELRVLDMQARKSSYGVLADVLATGTQEGQVRLHRFATFKDGNRLFILEARSPATPPEDAKTLQTVFFGALTAFQLTNPTHERFAEPFAFLGLPGSVPLQVAAASSWQANFSPNAPAGGSALQLENKSGDLSLGTIFIVTAPAGGEAPALERVTLENLAANGIHIVPGSGVFAALQNTPLPSQLASADAKRGNLPLDMTLLRAGSQDVSVSALLLSPAHETNFEAWAINRRAFEIVVESLQPQQ